MGCCTSTPFNDTGSMELTPLVSYEDSSWGTTATLVNGETSDPSLSPEPACLLVDIQDHDHLCPYCCQNPEWFWR